MSSEEQHLMDPPRYDMLCIKFRGDAHELVLPYCEVANGNITDISESSIEIVTFRNNKRDQVKMGIKDFVHVVETTFDLKEIVQLSVQLAGAAEQIKLL